MEIEKLIAIGEKKLGLKGTELQDFVTDERAALKKQRDEERQARAEAREYKKEEEERRHEEEQRKCEYDREETERKHRFELEKMEMEARLAKELAEAGKTGDIKGFQLKGSNAKAPTLPAFNEAKDDIDAYLIRF